MQKPSRSEATVIDATETNPWLAIPLADYEGHMRLAHVAQAQALASEFENLLAVHMPASVALLGCAGGNGLERIDPDVTRRVVALDINPAYVDTMRARFEGAFDQLDPVVCDIASAAAAPFAPVDLVFAGLLLEYVPLEHAMRFIRSGLAPHGILGCVIQQESASLPRVSDSPYTSLGVLSNHMTILTSDAVVTAAESCGFRMTNMNTLQMPNGKLFISQVYVRHK